MLSNYPPGVSDNTPFAPWNSYEVPEKDFDVTCSQTLSKIDTVCTSNYIYEADCDEDGCYQNYDTSDTCWDEEWHDNDHYTPLQLINLFKAELEKQYNEASTSTYEGKAECRRLKHLISECENWEEDETEYIKE